MGRNRHRLDEFAGGSILLAVAQKEILERQRPAGIAAAQMQGGTQGDQRRGRVADRRAVGDIAADGSHVAHLIRAEPAQQVCERRVQRRERRPQRRDRDPGPDPQPLALALDPLQIGDAGQEGDQGQVAQALGQPQPDVGGTGDQGGVGVGQIPLGQLVGADRAESAGAGAVCPRPGPHPRGYLGKGEIGRVGRDPGGHGGGLDCLCRLDDRGVAGAAAKVARQHVVVIVARRGVGGGQGYHDTRGAEAALAGVMVDQRALHRVQGAIGGGDAFDRAHRLAMHLGQQQDAGVDRARASGIAEHHGAGAAIALVAALLGAHQAALAAQPVKQGSRRVLRPQANRRSIEPKRDLGHPKCPPPSPRSRPGLMPMRARPMRRKAGHAPLDVVLP